ncbi:MAG: hypothetical protein ACO1SV_01710 [Fimbriimonas sp.]
MNSFPIVRALVLVSTLATGANAFDSSESAAVVRTPSDLSQVEALKPGALTKSTCADSEPCLAVPLAVTGVNEFGESETVVTQYPVGPELVAKVKDDFQETADVVLRNLRPALQSGVKAKDHSTRLACKQSIAAVDQNVKYRVASGVKMPVQIETTVSQLAKRVATRIKRPMVVTSAARTPTTQAEALRTKISLGDNIVKLYANKEAAASVLQAYKQAKWAGGSKQQVVESMANVIRAQMDKGVYLSNHLREGAIDVRTRDLTHWQRKQLVAAAKEVPGVGHSILESTPPHLHLEIERAEPEYLR